jgi:hypothetical protein
MQGSRETGERHHLERGSRRAGPGTSAAYRRLAEAASKGYVLNQEDRPRRPGRYVVGEPMPEERELLPRNPWSQDVCTIAGETERVAADAVLVGGRPCVRCVRYGPDHSEAHIAEWAEAR